MPDKLRILADRVGIHFPAGSILAQDSNDFVERQLAMDAQSASVTYSNSAIPAFLTTVVDPKIIEMLVTPMKAAEISGLEVKKGSWIDTTWMFSMLESSGNVSSYDDFSTAGRADSNVNFPERQQHFYQVNTEWGERELARMGQAKIDWAAQKNIASVLTLNKFQNLTYFYGVAGLQNYGILNDPSLTSPVVPTTKTAGHSDVWIYNGGINGTGLEIYADIQKLFGTLQSQAQGLVNLSTPMTLAMSPSCEVALTATNQYNVNVFTLLKSNFPNLRIVTAPEYAGTAGNLIQLFADEIEGQRTLEVAFSEKLRAHPVVVAESSFKQKKSQGSWGAIWYRPFLCAQMLGA